MMHIISLGAGVQSTTMALMAAHGEITPMPHCAIFADTQSEPDYVYEHLAWLSRDGFLPFPINIVTAGNLGADLEQGFSDLHSIGKFVSVPLFIKRKKSNGVSFEQSMGRRQCTRIYKIEALKKQQRRLLGYKARQRIPDKSMEVWIGISLDEAMRARPSRENWQINRYPLLEKMMMRKQCVEWLREHDYQIPGKSACTFCPYRDDNSWREMKMNNPKSFAHACKIDNAVRNHGHLNKQRNELYVHRSLVPLAEVDFSTPEDHGQLNLFNNECEGMCGV
jgi:hypothetical protein